MKSFITLDKLKQGDQVAIVATSGDAAARFPWVFQTGLERLQNEFHLKPKHYKSTNEVGPSLQAKADDLMAAFADPDNKAVISTIGGFDQIKMIKLLEPKVFVDNPKPFFGYSDNTHLVNFLWDLGIPSYYGGSIMTQYAFPDKIPSLTVEYLTKALFAAGEVELKPASEFSEQSLDWVNETSWDNPRPFKPNLGWSWDGEQDAEGRLWGGCFESMVVKFSSDQLIPPIEDLDGCILFLESSEEIPDLWSIAYVLTGMGERGWFDKFSAILIGRAKAWDFKKQYTKEQSSAYRESQQKIVLETIRNYNKKISVIQNLDFGHTEPQIPVPSGKYARVSSKYKQIFFSY